MPAFALISSMRQLSSRLCAATPGAALAPRRAAALAMLVLSVALAGGSAVVQAQPSAPPAVAGAPAAGAPAAAPTPAPVVYAVAPAQGLRWPGADARSLPVEAGARLEIVAEQGDLIRVREGARFGWLPRSAVSAQAPVAAAPAAPVLPGAPTAPSQP